MSSKEFLSNVTSKKTIMNSPFDRVIDQAVTAAQEATAKYLKMYPNQWYPCGFAWVKIRPARGKFVKRLKERNIGSVDTVEGGYTIWNPSGNATQCMEAKEAGAREFARVLIENGITAHVWTRLD